MVGVVVGVVLLVVLVYFLLFRSSVLGLGGFEDGVRFNVRLGVLFESF